MHEVGIMQSALMIASEQARASGATYIHQVRLRIGKMTGVVPEALHQAFAVLREDTMAQEAQLIIEHVPGVCWCDTCQKEFESQGLFAECPDCGMPSLDVRHGMEMELISMEVS